jgi:hypothetical protein
MVRLRWAADTKGALFSPLTVYIGTVPSGPTHIFLKFYFIHKDITYRTENKDMKIKTEK